MNALYDMITVLPVSLLSVLLLGRYAGIPENRAAVYVICLLCAGFLTVLRHMKRKNRLFCIGTVSVFLAGLILAAGEEYRRLFFTKYLWVIWTCCFSAAALIIGILMNKSIWNRRAVSAALLVFCIAGTIAGNGISKAEFALICLLLFVHAAEEIQRRWNKSGYPEMREHITRTAPFFLAASLLVYLIPAPAEPYDWAFFKELYHRAETFAERVYGSLTHRSDDYASVGFSDRGGFASGISGNDEEVLLIHADRTPISDFKLIGCISDDFTGREWRFDTESGHFSRMMDTLETFTAVRQFAPSERTDYLEITELAYENRFYNTQYIFSPAKTRLRITGNHNAAVSDRNGSILSNSPFRYKDTYSVSCYLLNYSHPQLESLLCGANPISEEEWRETVYSLEIPNGTGFSFEDYQEYRMRIAESCCSSGVSDRVKAILDSIQHSAANRYQAAKMLEAYLGNMEYSTDCGALPDTVSDARSFLDYFLFTSGKGFCMHFATAFVLMANEMGMPCRYVQGYSAEKDADGVIAVRQSHAHAWPEVYFEHVGWVSFEPTPGFADHTGWALREGHAMDFGYGNFAAETGFDSPETPQPDEKAESESAGMDPLILMIPSLAALGFLILFIIISRAVIRKKYLRMSCCEKYRYLAQQNLRFFRYLGFRIEEGETLAEFMNRIMQSDRQALKAVIGFIPVYEAILYSDREITDADIRSAEHMHQTLRAMVKKSRMRFRLIFRL